MQGQMEPRTAVPGSFSFEFLQRDVFMCLRVFEHVHVDALRPEEDIGSHGAGTTGSYKPPDLSVEN